MVERKTLNLVVVGSIPIEGAFWFGLNVPSASTHIITQSTCSVPCQTAFVAQMVERKTLNLVVVGSIPIEGAFLLKNIYLAHTNHILICEDAMHLAE